MPLNTGVFSKYGVQKKNPTLPDTIVSELEWDYGAPSEVKSELSAELPISSIVMVLLPTL